MLATTIRFLTCDSVTTASALYAMALAWFGEGTLPTVIALLLVANLALGIAVSVKRLRRK